MGDQKRPSPATTSDLVATVEQLHEILPFLSEETDPAQFCTAGQASRTIEFVEREIARRKRRAARRGNQDG